MKNQKFQIVSIIILCLTVLWSCKNNSSEKAEKEPVEESRYIVEIEAIDYAFKMQSEVKSGWVTFDFENLGHKMHFGMLIRFNRTLEQDDLDRYYAERSHENFMKLVGEEGLAIVGGPGLHTKGQESEVTIHLKPGDYLMTCNTNTVDGTPHYKLGMEKFFKVTGEKSEAVEPKADLELTLNKYLIEAKGDLRAGKQTIAVNHSGGSTFDIHLMKLNDTSQIGPALKFMDKIQSPSKVIFESGVEQTEVDKTSYITLDFEPGDYAWISHEYGAMGMIKEFSILEDGSSESFEPLTDTQFKEIPINIDEDSVSIVDQVQRGPVKLVIENTSSEEHNITIGRLEEGKTFDDYLSYIDKVLESRKKGTPLETENPRTGYKVHFGDESELKFDLNTGDYVLFCDAKDDEGNYIHWRKNEIASFEVK